ncbi:MAG: hypothetical protein ACR2LQ_09435 [Acidimicrobiales bacterium]
MDRTPTGVRQALAHAGVDALYGSRWPGLPVVPVTSAALGALLAAAHERVTGRAAGVVDGETIAVHGHALDLDAANADPAPEHRDEVDPAAIARIAAAVRPVLLAGPGVVAQGMVEGLHALATAGSLGVLNTWGAKGVFDWRSHHHLATIGLQQRDFELGGLAAADLIIATGTDEAEASAARWQLAPHIELAPDQLGAAAELLERPHSIPQAPPLRTGLAAVTQAGWTAMGTPLAPTRATLGYATVIGSVGGMVAGDPGWAGYWIARTFATTEPGAAIVPAAPMQGFAAACTLVARLLRPLRPVLTAVDALDTATQAVLEAARSLGVGIGVEVWCDDGELLDAEAHTARLRELAVVDRPTTATLATDSAQRQAMIDVAGPVIAWGGSRQLAP